MAEIVLRMAIPEDDDLLRAYGVIGMAEDAREYLSGCHITKGTTYEVVSTSGGPIRPTECHRCGYLFHEGPCNG